MDETVTNYIASLCLGGRTKDAVPAAKKTENNTFELEYNVSCALISERNFAEATKHLNFAKRLCEESLKEQDFGDDEIQDEMAVIRVQEAYVKQLLGNSEEARKIYEHVLSIKYIVFFINTKHFLTK